MSNDLNECALNETEAEMKAFCECVGELVIWASVLDGQLTKAVIRAFTLTETPLLEPVIAEIDARAKIEMLRARTKHIDSTLWSKGIKGWADKIDKVNKYRNTVAHHQVVEEDGKLILYSTQATKLLKRIKDSNSVPANTVDNIREWIAAAKDVYAQGNEVLASLDRFAEEFAKTQNAPAKPQAK